MSSQREFSPYEQLKWLLLDHAGANLELGIFYGLARQHLQNAPDNEIDELVHRAMLELYDEGLVAFFRAERPNGYNLELDQVEHLNRKEVIRELDNLIADVEPDELVWVRETLKGAEVFRGLPTGAVPKGE